MSSNFRWSGLIGFKWSKGLSEDGGGGVLGGVGVGAGGADGLVGAETDLYCMGVGDRLEAS